MLLQQTRRDNYTDFQLYRYVPSLPAAIVVASLFAILTIAHSFKARKWRTGFFIPFIIGLLFEAIGYAGRAWSHYSTTSLAPYIIQSILILVAPALYAASIYMVLGRIIALFPGGPACSIIPLRWMTKLFVLGDCVSFFTQIVGGGIQAAGTLTLLHIGEKLIVAGLFVQIFMFGFFVITMVVFHWRFRARVKANAEAIGDGRSQEQSDMATRIPWKKHIYVLYLSSGIILIRSVFRVIEYLQGNGGWILQQEYLLYIFDAALMLTVPLLFLFCHPGELINSTTATYSQNFAQCNLDKSEQPPKD